MILPRNCLIVSSTWKSGHSDPTKLKESAQEVQRLSPTELKKRQMEIKVKYFDLNLKSQLILQRLSSTARNDFFENESKKMELVVHKFSFCVVWCILQLLFQGPFGNNYDLMLFFV